MTKLIEREFRYWPRNKPVPDGWRDHGEMIGSHGRYSRLIERVVDEQE